MLTGFNKIFWGLILVLLDFRIQNFDILPDFIGYWMIYQGLQALASYNYNFGKAKMYAAPLLVLSITDFFQWQIAIKDLQFSLPAIGFILLFTLITVLNLFMIYYVCKGISEMSLEKNLIELSKRAKHRWQLYLYLNIGLLIIRPIFVLNPQIISLNIQFVAALIIPLVIITLIILVLLAGLIKDADNAFGKDITF